MASFPWQPYYPQLQHPFTLGGTRQKRLAPHELIKMLYEPTTLMEDSASNTSSSLDSFTTNTTTTTTTSDSDSCSCSPQQKPHHHHHHRHHHHHHDLNNNNNIGSRHSQSSHNSSKISSSSSSKRRSYHLLLREIRRLRAENDGLRQMVDTIKQDLRFERESRQISERCHQKYYTESSDRQVELELDVMDKDSEIEELKERIAVLEAAAATASPNTNNATSTTTTSALSKSSSFSRWGCFDFDDDDDELFCQPIMGESATPDPLTTLGQQQQRRDSSEEDEDEDEEYEDDDDVDNVNYDQDGFNSFGSYPKKSTTTPTDDEKFEQLATSYLHQAILSKLTSARANLELDDLMLKYDPSPAVVLRMLATSFVVWVNNVVSSSNESAVKSLTHGVTEGFLNFWKAILEKHVHDDDDQCQFLNEAERILDSDQQQAEFSGAAIVDNFHRLLIMLYKYDIVDGEAITRWWRSVVVVDEDGQVACRLRGVTRSFAQWLDEDEDEDEDEEEEEEEEEEEDGDYSSDDDEDSVFDGDAVFAHDIEDDHHHNGDDDMEINSDSDTVIDASHTSIEDHKLLESMLEQDRQYCACQFEENNDMKDNNNTINQNNNNNNAHSKQSPEEPSGITCKCQDILYTTTTTTSSSSSPTSHTADEKKPKKSVRIVL